MADLTELQRLAEGATPGEWHACKDGTCSCAMVWCADYPVATVTRGKWGDTFPSLRLVGDSSIGRQVEPYTDMIEYGEVSEKLASANAAYIAAMNPDTAKKLIAVALLADALVNPAQMATGYHQRKRREADEAALRTALRELAGSPQERRE